jgi:hypothetical protein
VFVSDALCTGALHGPGEGHAACNGPDGVYRRIGLGQIGSAIKLGLSAFLKKKKKIKLGLFYKRKIITS